MTPTSLDFPNGLADAAPLHLLRPLAAATDAAGVSPSPEARLNRLVQRVRLRLTVPRGSVPLDRTFGIDPDVLDEPLAPGLGLVRLRAAIATALLREPAVRLRAVELTGAESGRCGVTVRLDVLAL